MNPPSPNTRRHTAHHVDAWRETGFAVIPGFLSADEIRPLLADYDRLYRARRDGGEQRELDRKPAGEIGRFHPRQFLGIHSLPYDGSVEMNLLSLHPALIALARDLLGVPQVHLYQSHTWAKFTGEADYDQPFHCDFGNHTLTVPADTAAARTVDFIVYLTDVTDGHGAMHYVTKQDSDEILGRGEIIAPAERQAALKARERSAASTAGTVLAHGIDTFHRGTNLTVPNGHRYTMTIGYKAAGNDMIGYNVWQHAADRPWHLVLNHASPEQLACIGIPLPGDPFWTPRTLALTAQRWPDWDMAPWREA